LTAIKDLKIEQMDAITAFLQGESNTTIYVELLVGYCSEGDYVSLLLRALYSLKQSLRLWQEKLCKELEKLGYKPMEADHCIYTMNAGLQGIIIITYINNFLLIGPNIQEIKALKA
jgi:hypothetical protein